MSANIIKYRKAFDTSQTLLDITGTDEFPLDFDVLFSKKKGAQILVSSLKDYNTWISSKNLQKWVPLFIADAKCFYYSDRDTYMIIYNECRPEARIRFSLAHELGHIVLEHLNDERTELSRGGVDDPTYYAMEGAANTFAGNLLAPPILIDDFLSGSKFDVERISTRFNISPSATKAYRAEDYKYWKSLTPSKHEKAILKRCHSALHKHICIDCGATFEIEGSLFCPICGASSSSLYYRGKDSVDVIYPGVELNKSGQAKQCVQCKNEEHLEKSTYCMICGKTIVNQCTYAIANNVPCEYNPCSHDEPLPGNARFCPYCGSETTFLKDGVLRPWDAPQKPRLFAALDSEEDDSPLPF
ncbi:ImmA/IrrE family metallo-endopeptidase [Intestinimonas butyriciproducens]|uniref:Zn-dependent peptidase ImmA (M78 family) n=1 Tax=Intestinimonas butyriciproducens TaxID=1297617 RepID=A0A2U1BF88_9FIRM|nr:ImmA/IrrE family metallo-endopeptidase [Intestinimonas butyriciproducens]MBU5230018.1 ImmA/IrrE family metallo-endopeptidase [Intestinimonas butyriciproducens]MCR1907365.1 ImmA/IrrE family metallo-endopeptidase [Intestinimonas butyriciproducens]PVY47329.1 Zn-dependent peptidase ImmA (M78 family) [Intestinimonas butyriciproducens]QBB66306.1 hypothetical protein SRB521_02047 [Intestinimonas butyriciproducens]